ncbi:MAG: hypothetical protein ABFS42_08145 [Candidatus Krumholzibacteriota bacterium]
MLFQKSIWILALVLGLAILVGLTGCATGSGGSSSSGSRSRGKLSDAMGESTGKEEAKGRGQGRTRTKNDTYTSDYGDEYYEEDSDEGDSFLVGLILSLFSGDDDEEEPAVATSTYLTDYSGTGNRTWSDNGESYDDDGGGLDITRGNLNFWYSRSLLAGDAIRSFSNYTLMYSGYTAPRYRAHAGVYYGRGKAGSQADVKDGLRWISEAGIDVGSRGYFTPDHTLLGMYMLVGLRVGALYWSYNTALDARAEDGTPEKISRDGLMVFTPYVGLGTSLLQTESVHLGINFTVGGRLAVDKTFENYENDLFKHVGEYKLNIEASIFF